MTAKQAITILKKYNRWRRGGKGKQPDPKIVGEAINVCIQLAEYLVEQEDIIRYHIKPILRPLIDLVKTIEHDGSSFVPCRLLNTDFTDLIKHPEDYRHTSYIIVNALLEWHFDIFGLIGRGLAIDINTLIMEIKKNKL